MYDLKSKGMNVSHLRQPTISGSPVTAIELVGGFQNTPHFVVNTH